MAYCMWQNVDDEELLRALRSGDVDAVCSILDRTDSADLCHFQSTKLLTEACSVLHNSTKGAAAAKINISILECLLKRGYCPNANDTGLYKDTPLHTAALRGDLDAVELLLRYNANVSAVNRFGQTPLHHACRAGAIDVAGALLSSGCDVDSKDCDECTPLFHAVAADQPAMVHMLIQKGADVDAVNDELLSALDQALIYNRRSMISLLLKAGCQIDHKKEGCIYYLGHYCNSILYSLMADSDSDNLRLLLDCGYTLDNSILNSACQSSSSLPGGGGCGWRVNTSLLKMMQQYSQQPRSLYSLCRIHIRATVNMARNSSGPSLEARLDSLSLPRKVRDFLTLRENTTTSESGETAEE